MNKPAFRIVAKLDFKQHELIHPLRLEGLRRCGPVNSMMLKLNEQGIDEFYLNDLMASLHQRPNESSLFSQSLEQIFIPVACGGGVKSLSDAESLIANCCEKIVVNTQGLETPELITQLAKKFGSQSVVVSIDCKKFERDWSPLRKSGREKDPRTVNEWISQALDLGAGEIFINSVDFDGDDLGLDRELLDSLKLVSSAPHIFSGGVTCVSEVETLIRDYDLAGVALSHVLYSQSEFSVRDLKNQLRRQFPERIR